MLHHCPLCVANQSRLASKVVISALSIPLPKKRQLTVDADEDEVNYKVSKLCNLLDVSTAPTRESLLKDIVSKKIFEKANEQTKALYALLEGRFHPFALKQQLVPILTQFSENQDMIKYLKPLKTVILNRLIQSLSASHANITLSKLVSLASLPSAFKMNEMSLEKFIVQGVLRGDFNVKLNQKESSVTFETQNDAVLSDFTRRLFQICSIIAPAAASEKETVFAKAIEQAENERQNIVDLREKIEKNREEREQQAQKLEQEAHRNMLSKMQADQELERQRFEEEQKRREEERLRQQREEIERTEAKKLLDEIVEEFRVKNFKIDEKTLEGLSVTQLRAIHLRYREEEQKQKNDRMKALFKKLDYTERAIRLEEVPLLESDYERQKKEDAEAYETYRTQVVEDAKKKHVEALKFKSRLSRMMDDYTKFAAVIEEEDRKIREAREVEEAKMREEMEKNREEEEEARRIEEEARRVEREAQAAQEAAEREAAKPVEIPDGVYKRGAGIIPVERTGSAFGREGSMEGMASKAGEGPWRRARAAEPVAAVADDQAAPSRSDESAWRRKVESAPSTESTAVAGGTDGAWRRSSSKTLEASQSGMSGDRFKRPGAAESTADGDAWRRGGSTTPRTEEPKTEGSGAWRRSRPTMDDKTPSASSIEESKASPSTEPKKYVPPVRRTQGSFGSSNAPSRGRGGDKW